MWIAIHSQDHSRVDHVDFNTLADKGYGAEPTNLAGYDNVWTTKMCGPDGTEYQVHFAFSDDEAEDADADAGRLPWNADHVVRIEIEE